MADQGADVPLAEAGQAPAVADQCAGVDEPPGGVGERSTRVVPGRGHQNSSGHHGATGQPNAVAAWVTAPGLISVTRPAAWRVASDVPPR